MPNYKRHKNSNWQLTEEGTLSATGVTSYTNGTIKLALLMDLRDELQEQNQLLRVIRDRLAPLTCHHFLQIPKKLDRICRNTTRKKRTHKLPNPKTL